MVELDQERRGFHDIGKSSNFRYAFESMLYPGIKLTGDLLIQPLIFVVP